MIKHTQTNIKDISTHEKASTEVIQDAQDFRAQPSVKEQLDETFENDPDENIERDKDFKNVYDMDALSEFPIDFDISQRISVPSTSYEGGNVQSDVHNVKRNQDDTCLATNSRVHSMSDETTGTAEQNNVESMYCPRKEKPPIKKVSKCELESNTHFKSIANEFCKSPDSLLISNEGCASKVKQAGHNETQTVKMETASQVLRDLSLRQLSDISHDAESISDVESNSQINHLRNHTEKHTLTRDKDNDQSLTFAELGVPAEGVSEESVKQSGKTLCEVDTAMDENLYSNVELVCSMKRNVDVGLCPTRISIPEETRTSKDKTDEQNEKFKITKSSCQKRMPLNSFSGFSTASGKKVTISEKSMQKARKLMIEVSKEEEGIHREVGGTSNRKVDVGVSNEAKKDVKISKGLQDQADENENVLNHSDKIISSPTALQKRKDGEGKSWLKEQPDVSVCTDVKISRKPVMEAESILNEGHTIVANSPKVNENKERDENNATEVNTVNSTVTNNFVTATDQKETNVLKGNDDVTSKEQDQAPKTSDIEFPDCDNVNEQYENGLSTKNGTPLGFTTASGNKVSISEASVKKAKSILNDIGIEQCGITERSCGKMPKFGFSTALGNEILVSEESLKKARKILNEIESEEQSSGRKMVNKKHRVQFSAAADRKMIATVTENNRTKIMMNDTKSGECSKEKSSNKKTSMFGFSTASGNEISISEESLRKARKILDAVDKEGEEAQREVPNAKRDVPSSTITSSHKRAGFTASSGNNGITVSEDSNEKSNRLLSDVETNEKTKGVKTCSKIPKFGFSTASGHEISVSEESLKMARKILNEVDSEDEKRKIEKEKHDIPSSRVPASDKPVTLITASGNVPVSLTSIHKDLENEDCIKEERLFRKIPKFGFCTASGNEISVSEESLKKARKILNEVDSEGQKLEKTVAK